MDELWFVLLVVVPFVGSLVGGWALGLDDELY